MQSPDASGIGLVRKGVVGMVSLKEEISDDLATYPSCNEHTR